MWGSREAPPTRHSFLLASAAAEYQNAKSRSVNPSRLRRGQ